MGAKENRVLTLASEIAGKLACVEGVEAVVLNGSRARGEAHPDSDVDLGLYYKPERPFGIRELNDVARGLDDRRPENAVTEFGAWGPWINGGGWLVVGGVGVDLIYRDLGLVERKIRACMDGKTSSHYQPGHPHGFHTHIYAGEVHHCKVLHDGSGHLARLKELVADYPSWLKEAVIRSQLWEARFALDTARGPATRGDSFYVSGCLFRCAACLAQVLFALNETYLINEKGSVAAADALPLRPEGFSDTVSGVLAACGTDPEGLADSIGRFDALTRRVDKLCGSGSV